MLLAAEIWQLWAEVVAAASKELASRTQSDESCRLREANTRLTGEVADLRRQLNELQERVANMAVSSVPVPPSSPPSGLGSMEIDPPPLPQREKRRNREGVADSSPSSPTLDTSKRRRREEVAEDPAKGVKGILEFPGADAFMDAITSRVANFVNARLAAFEQRLPPEKLRPALQADKKTAEAGKGRTYAQATSTVSKEKERKGGDGKGSESKSSAANQSTSSDKGGNKKPGGKPNKNNNTKKAIPAKNVDKGGKPQQRLASPNGPPLDARGASRPRSRAGTRLRPRPIPPRSVPPPKNEGGIKVGNPQ